MDRLLSMRVFQQVIAEGSFAGAARALDMSPAVVTRLVADLEDHLGTRLVHRSTRRLSLSNAGEVYLGRVGSILQDIDEAHALASSHTQELSGELRVLALPVLATYILAPLVAGFQKMHPKIVLDIHAESFKEPPIEDYDITLFATSEEFDGNVIARKIATTQAILVATPEYLARKGTPKTPQDLLQHDCLRHNGGALRTRTWRLHHGDDLATYVDLDVAPVLWSNHIETLLSATLDGAGITATTVELVAPFLASGDLVRVLSPWVAGHLVLYAGLPSRKFLPQRTRVFLDYLVEQTRMHLDSALLACNDKCA